MKISKNPTYRGLDKQGRNRYNTWVLDAKQALIDRLFDNASLIGITEAEVCKLLKPVRHNSKGCWIRGRDSSIYTSVSTQKYGNYTAHRLSLALYKGHHLLLQSCHHCDIRACINPEHLIEQTQSWNMKDAWNKGTKIPRTKFHGPSKKYPARYRIPVRVGTELTKKEIVKRDKIGDDLLIEVIKEFDRLTEY